MIIIFFPGGGRERREVRTREREKKGGEKTHALFFFSQKNSQAFREGMRKGGARLLEPIMKVEVTTPEDHMGDVIGDLNSRRGLVAEFIDKPAGIKLIKASVPLSEMFQYVSTLRGMTKGRAQYTMQLEKYEVVPPSIQEKIVAQSGGSKVTI